MKYVLIICAFLAVWGLFNQYRVNYAQTQIDTLQGEKTTLKNEIKDLQDAVEKFNKAQERAGEKIEKVRTIVRNVKSDCDCYNTLLPDGVRKILRED